jgi:poly-beta-1,6-N-acetyl-D-glucosamine synthase
VMFPAKPRKWKAGIVVGRTNTIINHNHRWNVWLLFRAYAHWRYQVFYRRGQSILNAMNCISGSNSVYTPEVLDHVLIENPPYAVDDTWWTLEVRRNERRLGRIVYGHKAIAWICDPLTMKAWYKQSLRWMWGMMQGARGHKVLRRRTWFDFTYGLMVLDWVQYVTGATIVAGFLVWGPHFNLWHLAIWYFAGVYAFALLSAIGTGYWRILLVVPVFLPMDFLFRLVLMHALVKTIRRPTVSTNVWESPGRYELEGGV